MAGEDEQGQARCNGMAAVLVGIRSYRELLVESRLPAPTPHEVRHNPLTTVLTRTNPAACALMGLQRTSQSDGSWNTNARQ